MSPTGCFFPLRNNTFYIGSTRLTGTLLPSTSKPARSIWHVICRSIFCSCDSVFGMTQFTRTLTGLSRIEYGSLTCCKDRPSGSLDLTYAVWEKYTEITCKMNSFAFAASLDSVSLLAIDNVRFISLLRRPVHFLTFTDHSPDPVHSTIYSCSPFPRDVTYVSPPILYVYTFRTSPLTTYMHSLASLRAVGLLLLLVYAKFVWVSTGSCFIRQKYEHVYNKEKHEIWGSHRGNYKENCVLGYGVVQNGRN